MLNAKPHINGNSEADFLVAARALVAAAEDAKAALALVRRDCVHGRNYQHLAPEEAATAQDADADALLEAMEQAKALRDLANSIWAASKG